ncbi:MAG: phosphatase PAP2 family protein [Bacteroidetes bacterium]|nr:phosphatase PAP2 family protein [Bacteroidota bacterium]
MKLTRSQKIFLSTTAGIWLMLVLFSILLPKAHGFFLMQLPHPASLIVLMKGITFLADGLFVVLLTLTVALFVNARHALLLIMGFALSGLAVQTLKRSVFADAPRPVKFFEIHNHKFDIPEGLNPHRDHSFPSGHSATAAALMTFLAFRSRKINFALLYSLGIFLIAYTRVYLFQHFPVDAAAGILIGVLCQLVIEAFSAGRLNKLNRKLIANR